MPIYEYRCENGHTFEVMQRMSDPPVTKCEVHDAPVERIFNPIAVHFKGSGFYSTDYGSKKRSRELKEAAGEGKAGGDGNGAGEGKDKQSKDGGGSSTSKPDSKSEAKATAGRSEGGRSGSSGGSGSSSGTGSNSGSGSSSGAGSNSGSGSSSD